MVNGSRSLPLIKEGSSLAISPLAVRLRSFNDGISELTLLCCPKDIGFKAILPAGALALFGNGMLTDGDTVGFASCGGAA